jgi:LysM repeat protein
LVAFAAALAALFMWGPVQLSITPRTASETPDQSSQPPAATEPPRANDSQPELSADPQPKDGVAETHAEAVEPPTRPQPTPSPLLVLPAKVIPGFPPAPQDELTHDKMHAAIRQARVFLERDQPVEACGLLSDLYMGHRLTNEQRLRLAEELEPLTAELMRSHALVSEGQLYEIQPGDTLGKLARPFHVPPEFIARLNGIADPRRLRARQTLRFVQGPFDVLIEPAAFELTVLLRGKFVRRFPIGVGRADTPTPTGLNPVLDKQVNPAKWPDAIDRRKIAGGDPANPLGTRWIGIGLGYGIHGTNEPETIGQRASRGCIRMLNEDAEELYDMLVEKSGSAPGSRVLIR